MKEFDIKEHFTVPEGYFEQFTTQMMDKLPQQDFQPMRVPRRKPLLPQIAAAAAVVLLLGFSAYTFVFDKQTDEVNVASVADAETMSSDDLYSIDEAADYAMIDRQDLYEMITE